MFITTSPSPTILRHPFSLMITPTGYWYDGIRMMIQTQVRTMITVPNNSKILPRFQVTLIRMLAELTIILSYQSRYIPLLLINVLQKILDWHHNRIISNTNPGTTISPPTLSHPHLYHYPIHGIVNVILSTNNQ